MQDRPRISKIEVQRFEYQIEDVGLEPVLSLPVYKPGAVATMAAHALRIYTDLGVSGEYVASWGTDYVTLPMVARSIIGRNALDREGIYNKLKLTLRQHAQGAMGVWLSANDRPTLLNSYWREYYESIDHQVRITLDYAQVAYEQITYLAPNLTVRAPAQGLLVLEVKADPSLHRRVSNLLSLLPMQVERNSKYISGVQDALLFV